MIFSLRVFKIVKGTQFGGGCGDRLAQVARQLRFLSLYYRHQTCQSYQRFQSHKLTLFIVKTKFLNARLENFFLFNFSLLIWKTVGELMWKREANSPTKSSTVFSSPFARAHVLEKAVFLFYAQRERERKNLMLFLCGFSVTWSGEK